MNTQEKFDVGFQFVLKSEGGTNFDPVDRGGITKYGISSKSYPDLDIVNLTLAQAKAIYYHDYWDAQKCDYFNTPVATVLFDSSVNCGKHNASDWLQLALGFSGDDLDGIIGQKTILASKGFVDYKLAARIVGYRIKHYSELIKNHPEQTKFIKGWNNRAGDLLLYI